jgi:hypothetical protein
MKAIIIEECRFAEIRDVLDLQAQKISEENPNPEIWDNELWKTVVLKVYRNINYYFVRWAQEQGASGLHK